MRGKGHLGRWPAAGLAALLAAGLAAWLLALTAMPAAAEVLDRTIAVVNTHLVTWSDLDEQMRFEALENGRALKDLTEADRRKAFDHLVQDWILRDQMQGTLPAADSDVEERIADLRATLHKDEAAWAATLNSYGLSPEELRTLAANQLEILRFLEFRVRPLVRVSRKEVDEYYSKSLVPQVKAQGQTPEPEEQVTAKIRELLAEQKMNEEMEKWLQTLRSQSQVRVLWDGVR